MTLEEAIERVGFGRFQRRLLWICGAGWAADAMEVLLISFAIPAICREWGLTTAQAGFLATAIFLGMLLGAWFWGTVSDRLGRKPGFILTVLIDSGFGLASAFSPSFPVLVALRALTGFGVGGTLPVDYAVFAEFLPREKRGRYLVILEAFWALGALVAAGLSWLVVPRVGWRVLLGLSALPGLIVFWIRRHVPESPRFLLVHGREEEARQVLIRVAKENGRPLPDNFRLHAPKILRARVRDLWHKKYARTTALLWLIWFTISLGYYGVFTWLPNILVERGLAFVRSYAYAFFITLAQLPGYFSAAYFVERIGRRLTLGIYLLGSGLFTYLFAVATSPEAFLTAALAMSFFALGAWGALYAYTPEVYPTQLRTTGMGAASGMTRIAGALAPSLGGLLLGLSLPLALSVFAGAYFLGGLAALALPYETKGEPLADVVG
ncbi:MFS transporter [Candidatus Bipolaricaulota bacterium]|nr:MFS transporter [Candidatus Bipolaricaulota bacterium]